MKTCIHCSKELPENANFCPSCGTVQTETRKVKAPRPWRKKILYALIFFLLAAVVCVSICLRHRPAVYDTGGSEVVYKDRDGSYHVFLTWKGGPDTVTQSVQDWTSKLEEGRESFQPSMLYVYDPTKEINLQEEFLNKISHTEINVLRRDGKPATLSISAPAYNKIFPLAAMEADLMYTADAGVNDIVWTLHMKNGDTIILYQTYTVIRLLTTVYTPEDTPMNTTEDLQELLEQIWEADGSDTIATIYLPAVTYSGELYFNNRSYNLIGSTENDRQTTFTGTLSINSQEPQLSMLDGILFEGDGSGIGVSATQSAMIMRCILRGWDTAAYSRQGSWLGISDCTVENNRVGLLFDSTSSKSRSSSYNDDFFRNNDTAILLKHVPGTYPLSFGNTIFSDNRIDIDNPAEHPLQTENAIFES